jgi:hypothetical protein
MRTLFILFGLSPTIVCILLALNLWPDWHVRGGGIFLAVGIVLCSMIGALGLSEPRRTPENYSPGCRALFIWMVLVLLDAAILYFRFGISVFAPEKWW